MKHLTRLLVALVTFVLSFFLVVVILQYVMGGDMEFKPNGTAETNVNLIRVR